MIATDHTELLSSLSTKTHIIRWKHDTYTPLADGKRLHDSIAWSTFDMHEEAKHGIHLTHPERLVQKIVSYI
jgi:pimeloyl-ACP methyl ester carboxylesterase